MLKLYKNKKQTFECKIEIEGTSYSKAKSRLILFPSNDNRNVFFEGAVDGNTCKILLTPNLDIPKTGKALLEVIIDDTTLFQPWESQYEIVTEQVKVQNESISLQFEPSSPTVKVVEDVTVKDDKNRIIEPKKAQVKVVAEKKVAPKKKVQEEVKNKNKELFTEQCSDRSKKNVNEFLSTFKALKKSERKSLIEFISKKFNPSEKSKHWSKSIFVENKTLIPKIAMYCYELENTKI